MGVYFRIRNNDSSCQFHWSKYVVAALAYKQVVIAKAGVFLFLQLISTITATCLAIWSTTSTASEVWSFYGISWAAIWPLFFVIAWIKYAWWFRRSNWECDDECRNNDDVIERNDNDDFVYLRATKFSVN